MNDQEQFSPGPVNFGTQAQADRKTDQLIVDDMLDASIPVLAYLLGVGSGAGLVLLYFTQVIK